MMRSALRSGTIALVQTELSRRLVVSVGLAVVAGGCAIDGQDDRTGDEASTGEVESSVSDAGAGVRAQKILDQQLRFRLPTFAVDCVEGTLTGDYATPSELSIVTGPGSASLFPDHFFLINSDRVTASGYETCARLIQRLGTPIDAVWRGRGRRVVTESAELRSYEPRVCQRNVREEVRLVVGQIEFFGAHEINIAPLPRSQCR